MNAYYLAREIIQIEIEYGSDAVPYGLKGETRREIKGAVPTEK